MDKLFQDIFIPEREKVHMVVHCLEGDADAWWRRTRPSGLRGTRQISWDEFHGLLFGTYFLNNIKQKLEEDLKNSQQGDRSVQKYLREFTRLLNCVPFVAKDELHRVYLFERGLRPEIYTLVQWQRLQTLDPATEQALWVERGATMLKERVLVSGQSSERKRPVPEEG